MSVTVLLMVLLVWVIAGLLAAIAFGKVIRLSSPEDEMGLATSSGSLKYFRKTKKSRDSSSTAPKSRHQSAKRASG